MEVELISVLSQIQQINAAIAAINSQIGTLNSDVSTINGNISTINNEIAPSLDRRYCTAYVSNAFILNPSPPQICPLNSIVTDPSGMFNGGINSIVLPATGTYLISGAILFDNAPHAGQIGYVEIHANGPIIAGGSTSFDGGNNVVAAVSFAFTGTAGTPISLWGAADLARTASGSNGTRLTVVWLGA